MTKKGLTKGEEYRLKALSYIDRVMSGERPAGKYERLAVERHLNDLKMAMEKGIYFDDAAARRYLSFCQLIKHFEGEWAGQEFVPEDWQCFILYSIFGWKTKDGVRRFRYAAVEVPRKNGKTTLAAIIALIGMIADGENGAQVYSAAVDKDQAGICWNAAGQMIARSKRLSKVCKVWKTSITYEETASFYKPLSKETKNKDGLNPHFAICDEMHAWPTDDIYNLITSGMGARKQPLIFIITTAGFNKESPYFKMRKVYIDILEGVKTDENTFAIIYCPDEGDDWHDRATWYKASPNLGVSVKESFMEIEYQNAINKGGTHEVSFKTKNLNMWVDAPDVWISDDLVVRCDHGTTDDMLDGQKCWGAIDLASHMDINALALYFPELEHPAMKFFFWIPEAKVKEKEAILGAHIDSPRLDIKQNPLYEEADFAYLDTHYYGGVKKYQWVTLPLALHGVIVKKDGTIVEVNIGEAEEDPILYITDLLIHLSAKQMQKTAAEVITGEGLDILIGSRPLKDLEDENKKSAVKENILHILKEKYDVEEEDFLSAELEIVPAGKARECGLDRSMIAAYGQDDRVCAYTSFLAMLEMENPKKTSCCLLTDKEEIGSVGATGMQSRFFENSVAELLEAMGCYSELTLRRTLGNSSMLSSDVSAAFDPAFSDAFEKKNSAFFGRGIVLNKFTGARGKSGSNDANAEYVARIRNIFDTHNVAFQTAELGKVDVGGGGTIAYIAALYGMEVIDSGVAVLSMHAPWEVTSKADVYEAKKAYKAFLLDA